MKTISFNFENPSEKDKAVKDVVRIFGRAGCKVVTAEVDKAMSRRAGVTFRNLNLVFADGQKVTMAFKATGDVFEVRLNGKAVPLRNQEDHAASISEIAARLDAGRLAFQKALARVRVELPPSILTSRTKMRALKVERRDNLKAAVLAVTEQLAQLTGTNAPA